MLERAVLVGFHALVDPQRYSRQCIYLFKEDVDFKKAVHDFTEHPH